MSIEFEPTDGLCPCASPDSPARGTQSLLHLLALFTGRAVLAAFNLATRMASSRSKGSNSTGARLCRVVIPSSRGKQLGNADGRCIPSNSSRVYVVIAEVLGADVTLGAAAPGFCAADSKMRANDKGAAAAASAGGASMPADQLGAEGLASAQLQLAPGGLGPDKAPPPSSGSRGAEDTPDGAGNNDGANGAANKLETAAGMAPGPGPNGSGAVKGGAA